MIESLENRTLFAVAMAVTFDDLTGSHADDFALVESNLRAAGNDLSRHFAGASAANMEVLVRFVPGLEGINGHSVTPVPIGFADGATIYDQGAAYEVRTGIDPNGAAPDVIVNVGAEWLDTAGWLDPDASSWASSSVPADRYDARTQFSRLWVHAYAANGWYHTQQTDARSVYDRFVHNGPDGGRGGCCNSENRSFIGPLTRQFYRQPGVPVANPQLTPSNVYTFGAFLETELMNGTLIETGRRYLPTALTICLLADCGLPVMRLPIRGDANLDYRVDSSDFSILASNFGRQNRSWAEGNFNGFGAVDSRDFSLLASNFGQESPPLARRAFKPTSRAAMVVDSVKG